MERFWSKVQKTDECWLWTASTAGKGYGKFYTGRGRGQYAHRFSYELHKGPIPSGLTIDHLCCNPACVNPDHLEAIPNSLNRGRSINGKVTRADSRNRFRNVYRDPRKKIRQWVACIEVQQRKVLGGLFEHEEVAAAMVNVLSAKHFPGFRAWNPVEMG